MLLLLLLPQLKGCTFQEDTIFKRIQTHHSAVEGGRGETTTNHANQASCLTTGRYYNFYQSAEPQLAN